MRPGDCVGRVLEDRPEIALDETASTIPGWQEDNRLATTIVNNWKSGFYRHGRFACQVDAFWYHHGDLEKYHRLRSIIPADMAVSQDGQELNWDDYTEGFSPAAIAHLAALGIDV